MGCNRPSILEWQRRSRRQRLPTLLPCVDTVCPSATACQPLHCSMHALHLAFKLAAAAEAVATAALWSLRTSNFDEATASLLGAPWQEGGSPCGDAAAGLQPWRGVTCSPEGLITRLELPNLGLEGTLPAQLAELSHLLLLNLSGNAFGGGIPSDWLGPRGLPSLATADLSNNQLEGASVGDGELL